jgi:2-isopropylmalate synthase
VEAVIEAGAVTVNIPDTVGYGIPQEFGALIKHLSTQVPNIDKAVISVHCHNDLGLAVANSLSAVLNGARQVECAINGIGERAGNASLEEIVMAIRTRKDFFALTTQIVTEQISAASRLISRITGINVQPNKAIVGANAFAHESGIHQDGVLKEKITYEIMTPESIGKEQSELVLGKHSGRHAVRERLKKLGCEINDEEMNAVFKRFKDLADKKKEVFDEDLLAIIAEETLRVTEKYKLLNMNVASGTVAIPTATVEMEVDGVAIKEAGFGDGPVDAAFKTIAKITGARSQLLKYAVNAITGGTDALGQVTVRLEEGDVVVTGQGAHTDIIIASAKAYIDALNRLAYFAESRRLNSDKETVSY